MKILKKILSFILRALLLFCFLGLLLFEKLTIMSILGAIIAASLFLLTFPNVNQKVKLPFKKMVIAIAVIVMIVCIGSGETTGSTTSNEDTAVLNDETETTTNEENNTSDETTDKEESSDQPVVEEKTSEELEQEFKDKCNEYSYEEIFRNAEDHEGEYAKFTGQVIQVQESEYEGDVLRVNVTATDYGFYEDTIYVEYGYLNKNTDKNGPNRILEDDIIEIYGKLEGIETYTSILGQSISIPKIDAYYIVLK